MGPKLYQSALAFKLNRFEDIDDELLVIPVIIYMLISMQPEMSRS